MKRILSTALCLTLVLGACSPSVPPAPVHTGTGQVNSGVFGGSIAYKEPETYINKQVSADFSAEEGKNLAAIEEAYGIKLSAAQKAFLLKNKFLVMNILDTTIRSAASGDSTREFVDLFGKVIGPVDYKNRTQANAPFLSSDVFFNAYNNVYTELLKEMENKVFFPSMKQLSADFYAASVKHLKEATNEKDKKTWMEVRNYFAVPHAMFSTAALPLTDTDYYKDGQQLDPTQVQADFKAKDAKVDTVENAEAFVKNLKLDASSEELVLADLDQAFKAGGKGIPFILKDYYDAYAQKTGVEFFVDYSQFTPRGTYTSSSLRREYFRGMNWYIQTPFFLESPALTTDAFGISQLMAENPKNLVQYNQLEATINFLVGRSDDLMPADYLQALQDAKGAAVESQAVMEFLRYAHDPMIKSLAAVYSAVGTEETANVVNRTKGMRFFSGKFILDSFWTGQLTQGDEKVKPGYTQKLPPMASSLEVMGLLGSDYAKSKIPTLDFYKPSTSKAIDQAMTELAAKEAKLNTAYWQSNIYNAWLWTIKGLFSFQQSHRAELPRFMQSPMWDIKTLMTGAAFWTELRHATILYAKQSFAEKGGGPPGCDDRHIPEPPKGYIEPQPVAYARLLYMAKRTNQGLKDQGYDLKNMRQLDAFVTLMESVVSYTQKQLVNTVLQEKITSKQETDDYGKTCTVYSIDGQSDWEMLRLGILKGLIAALPIPTEGPILTAKDRRAALVADVHTGGDSFNDTKILYEGTGVPNVIIVAVKDTNGPRYTIGFTYSQYEFTTPYGGKRMTDEDWQKNFYEGDDTYAPYDYTGRELWPSINSWFVPILKVK